MGIHKFSIEAPTTFYINADTKDEAERIAWEYIQYCKHQHVQVSFICDEWTKVFYEWELVDKPEDHEYELTDYLERYA
jgi:hypothetical protein|tara:strand:- start:572 stop:805 length:234 start_codon:yes stop_codon:yes gene_type:complete